MAAEETKQQTTSFTQMLNEANEQLSKATMYKNACVDSIHEWFKSYVDTNGVSALTYPNFVKYIDITMFFRSNEAFANELRGIVPEGVKPTVILGYTKDNIMRLSVGVFATTVVMTSINFYSWLAEDTIEVWAAIADEIINADY